MTNRMISGPVSIRIQILVSIISLDYFNSCYRFTAYGYVLESANGYPAVGFPIGYGGMFFIT